MKKEKKKSLLKQLLKYSGNRKCLTYIGMVLSGVSAILALLPIVFIWLGVREVFYMYPNFVMSEKLTLFGWLAVITSILAMVIYFIALMCTHASAFRVAKNLRLAAITHLADLPLGYFNKMGSGKIRRTISESAGATETYLAHQIPDLVGAYITPVVVLLLLFVFDWGLGLISLIPLVLAMFSQSLMMGKGYKERIEAFQTSLGNMNNEAVEYVRGIPVVKTFGQSIFSFKKFYDNIMEYKKLVVKNTYFYRNPMSFYQMFLGSVAIFLVIGGVLLYLISEKEMEFLLDLIFYILFTPIFTLMMTRILWTSQYTLVAEDALNRINTLLETKPLQYGEKIEALDNFNISIENAAFKYENSEKDAVSNISLNIKEGQTVALVGASGSGKSTIASLIARFYDVVEGTITIGGVDVKNIGEETLMDSISFVFQNTNLYKSSILENVREGKPEATEEEVLEAIKKAQCSDLIGKLPDGIHTIVGNEGVFLSGGEAQRIAIARAILKNAPILLLDEATAFTDPENEHQIQLALSQLAKDKTVVMIAHRLSTVKNADIIHYMENGQIKESGTHNELLRKKGKYNTMWNEYQTAFTWKERKEYEKLL